MMWTEPLVVSIDPASIRGGASRITARVLWDYSGEQKTDDEPRRPFRSMIGLIVFDCGAERFGGAGSTSYSEEGGAGQVVAQYAINPGAATLAVAEPGTVAHDLVVYVCTQAKKGT
jgi:hypothetical protein